jgi:hypothetical protein
MTFSLVFDSERQNERLTRRVSEMGGDIRGDATVDFPLAPLAFSLPSRATVVTEAWINDLWASIKFRSPDPYLLTTLLRRMHPEVCDEAEVGSRPKNVEKIGAHFRPGTTWEQIQHELPPVLLRVIRSGSGMASLAARGGVERLFSHSPQSVVFPTGAEFLALLRRHFAPIPTERDLRFPGQPSMLAALRADQGMNRQIGRRSLPLEAGATLSSTVSSDLGSMG